MAEQVAAHLNFTRFARASRTTVSYRLSVHVRAWAAWLFGGSFGERPRKPGFEHSQFRRAQIQVLQSRDIDDPDGYIFPLCKHGHSSGSIQSSPSRTSPGGHLQPDQLGPEQISDRSMGPSSAKKWRVEHVGSHDVTCLEWIWFDGQTKSFPHPESLQLQLADIHSLKTSDTVLFCTVASAEPGRRTRARAAFRKVNDLWLVYYLGTREKSENLGPSQGNRNLKGVL